MSIYSLLAPSKQAIVLTIIITSIAYTGVILVADYYLESNDDPELIESEAIVINSNDSNDNNDCCCD